MLSFFRRCVRILGPGMLCCSFFGTGKRRSFKNEHHLLFFCQCIKRVQELRNLHHTPKL